MHQPLVAPTSMYSMKRSVMPLPRKWRAMGKIWLTLVRRLTTILTLRPVNSPLTSSPKPASLAAAMPSSTSATGKSTSFISRNTASSRPSKLTVTRFRPASLSDLALRAKSDPLVVRVRSSGVPSGVLILASWSIKISRFLRSKGSPPVRRILRTPWATNTLARRVISSKFSKSPCGR